MVNATIKYNEMKVVLYPKTQSRLEVDVDFYYNESDPENYTSEEESETEYESEDSDIEEIQIHDLWLDTLNTEQNDDPILKMKKGNLTPEQEKQFNNY